MPNPSLKDLDLSSEEFKKLLQTTCRTENLQNKFSPVIFEKIP